MGKEKKGKWFALGMFVLGAVAASFLSKAGEDLYHRCFSKDVSPQLTVDQKWEIFSILYAGGSVKEVAKKDSGSLKWFGAQPYYRHSVRVENTGSIEAFDVKIEIAGLMESHELQVEPPILDPRIGPLVPRYPSSNVEKQQMGPSYHSRIISVSVLPPKTNVQITIVNSLAQPAVSLTKVQNVMASNSAVVIGSVDEEIEKLRLNKLAQAVFSSFPPVKRDLWEAVDIKATVEFHPEEPVSGK